MLCESIPFRVSSIPSVRFDRQAQPFLPPWRRLSTLGTTFHLSRIRIRRRLPSRFLSMRHSTWKVAFFPSHSTVPRASLLRRILGTHRTSGTLPGPPVLVSRRLHWPVVCGGALSSAIFVAFATRSVVAKCGMDAMWSTSFHPSSEFIRWARKGTVGNADRVRLGTRSPLETGRHLAGDRRTGTVPPATRERKERRCGAEEC